MITLHDWIGKQKNLLTEFEQWWQENHGRSSVQFPASLDEGDWSNSLRSSVSGEKALLDYVGERADWVWSGASAQISPWVALSAAMPRTVGRPSNGRCTCGAIG
jgi:hypothetical protein